MSILKDISDVQNILSEMVMVESKNTAKALYLKRFNDMDEFEKLISIDPTDSFKYSNFIIKQFFKGNMVSTDDLIKFETQSKRGKISNPDIDSKFYNNYKNFLSAISEEDVANQQLQDEIDSERNIIYDENNVLILEPKTHRCSVKYGSSEWCTSYESPKNWNQYSQYGLGDDIHLFYILDPDSTIDSYKKVAIGLYNKTITSNSEKQSYIQQLNGRIREAKAEGGLTDPFGNIVRLDSDLPITGEDFIVPYNGSFYFIETYDISNTMISGVDYVQYLQSKGIDFGIFTAYVD